MNEYRHIAGKQNVVADALSRMDMTADELSQIDSEEDDVHRGQVMAYCMTMDKDGSIPDIQENPESVNTLCAGTAKELNAFPMNPALIKKEQAKDKDLQKWIKSGKSSHYGTTIIEDNQLVTYKGLIVIPATLQERVIAWYHLYLRHPGATRMEATLRKIFSWRGMRTQVEQYVKTCEECQLCKSSGQKEYGLLPPKEAEKAVPWNRVNVDLIGPYSVETPKGTVQIRALTMIDPVTGWFEIAEIDNPTARTVMNAFDDSWLTRYPRPQYIGYDGGSEFKNVSKKW